MGQVNDWDESYGVAHFTYRGDEWVAVEIEGNHMVFKGPNVSVSGKFGRYPTPEIARRVLDDFYRCVGSVQGNWALATGGWEER